MVANGSLGVAQVNRVVCADRHRYCHLSGAVMLKLGGTAINRPIFE